MQRQREAQSPGAEELSWGKWQQDWFATPGDLDDFIFYDGLEEAKEMPDP